MDEKFIQEINSMTDEEFCSELSDAADDQTNPFVKDILMEARSRIRANRRTVDEIEEIVREMKEKLTNIIGV